MRDRVSLLQHKLNEYQINKDNRLAIDWILLKDILNILSDILILIAHDLPDKLKWLGSILVLTAEVLKKLSSDNHTDDEK